MSFIPGKLINSLKGCAIVDYMVVYSFDTEVA